MLRKIRKESSFVPYFKLTQVVYLWFSSFFIILR